MERRATAAAETVVIVDRKMVGRIGMADFVVVGLRRVSVAVDNQASQPIVVS